MKRLIFAAIAIMFFVTPSYASAIQDIITSKMDGIFIIESVRPPDPAAKDKSKTPTALGTGFLVGENEILTNAHVVDHSTKVLVSTENSNIFEAEVVKFDPVIDLALVRIKDWERFKKENTYTVLTLAKSYDIKVMDDVYAIGNPWGLMFSVSKGIVSSPMRRLDAIPKFLIQTDAHVYNGNSGGPLLNDKGEVVGINSLMMAQEGGSYGFALHADIIRKVLQDWQTGPAKWATIGVTLDNENSVKDVIPNSPAFVAGLRSGDKIVEIKSSTGDYITHNYLDTTFIIALTEAPETIQVVVNRNGTNVTLSVKPNYKLSTEF